MKKTYKVVMLPTEKASKLFNTHNKVLHILNSEQNNLGDCVNQYLYILSDEEIKEGDWVLGGLNGTDIKQYGKYFAKDWKKIVATTDKSLRLPQLPESFIQAYIKSYNEGKPITEVDLECESITEKNRRLHGIIPDVLSTDRVNYILKTRPDNTVIVHQSKVYTRDEVIDIMRKFKADTEIYSTTEFSKKYGSTLSYTEMEIKWIQDNL